MTKSNTLLLLRYLAADTVGAIFYFPVWWYSKGAVGAALFLTGMFRNAARSLGVVVWLKNLFTPMFGQYDLASRLISFFLRLVTVVFYSLLLVVYAAILALLFLVWLALPVFILFEFVNQLSGIIKSSGP